MNKQNIFKRYQQLQQYVGWTTDDAQTIAQLLPRVEPSFGMLVDDFYNEIQKCPETNRIITGGEEQLSRLKQSLHNWLRELFSGVYDSDYVYRRWKIGFRHVEIGLDQIFVNAALSRLRGELLSILDTSMTDSVEELLRSRRVLNTLLDLDLALIEDAYQAEFAIRQQATERLVLIGQVAGGIAHELRNPLNVIKTSVFYLLNAKNPSSEKVAQHLERIDRQVGLADEVITSLTSFAQMPTANCQPFVLKPFLEELSLSVVPPENIRVLVDCPADLPPAVADAAQIRIVLGNLMRNAIEAMPAGGTLHLKVAHKNPYVQVSVSDSGSGIDPNVLPRIMEPFYSTKARGIGLGLPMAKAIVEKNEGQIFVESEQGKGSTFAIYLRTDTEGRARNMRQIRRI